MMVEPCSKTPNVSSVNHLQGPTKDSKEHPSLPLTPLVLSDLLDQMVQVKEQPAQQPGPVEEPSIPDSTES